MSFEAEFLNALRALPLDPAARGLADDAAVLEVGGARLVLTHDMIVEGVHFLADDPPGDVAWKLLAVNLSDLAAKGARPAGVLMGYTLRGDPAWDRAFVQSLGAALGEFDVALLGGDTVSVPAAAPRSFGLTAVGISGGRVPSRAGARPGDHLWITGAIGDAGAGLRMLRGEVERVDTLIERYRKPRPRLAAGERLAGLVTAMMDVSDGLLIDAARMAQASAAAVEIDLALLPLSDAYRAAQGDGRSARLAAAVAGDDYELLFTARSQEEAALLALSEALGLPFTRIGSVSEGAGLGLRDASGRVPLPQRLGWEHGLSPVESPRRAP